MISRTRDADDRPGVGLRRALRPFGPVIGPARLRDAAIGAFGAGLALLLGAALLHGFGARLAGGAYLIAPMGATAVILFALPNSPLAQPWSAIVGNTISALAALAVHQVTRDPALSIGTAVGLAIGGMYLARALHPPGGAVALTAALNPAMLDTLGLYFVVGPVLLGTVSLVLLAIVWHRLNGRVYPFRQAQSDGPHATADKAPQQRLGLSPDELARILANYRQSANLGVEDLARLIAAAEQVAAGHALREMTCGAIMSRDLVTVPSDTRLAAVTDLFRRHGFSSIPVVGPGDILLGVVFQLGLIRQARHEPLRNKAGFGRAMAAIRRDRTPDVLHADDVMTTGLPSVTPETPVAALLPLLSDGGEEAVPVMAGDRIVGIVTRTDLLSALARSTARGAG
ncbi:CBS domain-containing protein [Aurantimonas aggregata]|uniref:CBS domain-containing protein n=1 Tax=Aurantimonas aggregata TaxID=2047720 RepID=A0A6L9MFZ3_9HYPH|nr:HPP family protein [Aurantimonas aggregata]NDV86717.1 CBS domain-containing protein [Aurantimonas aggregata]